MKNGYYWFTHPELYKGIVQIINNEVWFFGMRGASKVDYWLSSGAKFIHIPYPED